jgi:hypothetical protein
MCSYTCMCYALLYFLACCVFKSFQLPHLGSCGSGVPVPVGPPCGSPSWGSMWGPCNAPVRVTSKPCVELEHNQIWAALMGRLRSQSWNRRNIRRLLTCPFPPRNKTKRLVDSDATTITRIRFWDFEKCTQFLNSNGFQLYKPFATSRGPIDMFCFCRNDILDLSDMYLVILIDVCQYLFLIVVW